jgi:hypothetical protein
VGFGQRSDSEAHAEVEVEGDETAVRGRKDSPTLFQRLGIAVKNGVPTVKQM